MPLEISELALVCEYRDGTTQPVLDEEAGAGGELPHVVDVESQALHLAPGESATVSDAKGAGYMCGVGDVYYDILYVCFTYILPHPLLPQQRLSVTPRREGQLRIVGLAWKLENTVLSRHDFNIRCATQFSLCVRTSIPCTK